MHLLPLKRLHSTLPTSLSSYLPIPTRHQLPVCLSFDWIIPLLFSPKHTSLILFTDTCRLLYFLNKIFPYINQQYVSIIIIIIFLISKWSERVTYVHMYQYLPETVTPAQSSRPCHLVSEHLTAAYNTVLTTDCIKLVFSAQVQNMYMKHKYLSILILCIDKEGFKEERKKY